MYHVTTIGAISIILYLLSYIGHRAGIINAKDHRSAWNIILLLTFSFTATAGILLALQATYKWDNPVLRQFLKWHVEVGIGMSFVALFHLSWHLKYYLGLFKPGRITRLEVPGKVTGEIEGAGTGMANLFILGLYTGIAQLIFIREIMNLAGGYELIAGIIFFCWMLLSAFGAFISGRNKQPAINKLIYFLPLSGLVSAMLLIVCSRLMLATGEYPTFTTSLVLSIVSLIPVCFISGALFIILTITEQSAYQREAGSSFGVETTGGIIAGLFVALTGGSILGNYQMLILSSLLVLALLLSINLKGKSRVVKGGIFFLLILGITIIIFSPDRYIRSLYLRGSRVEKSLDSKYGNISVTDYMGEKNILYNHRLYSYPGDMISKEENIHYAMLQHDSPEDVLLVSGGLIKHYDEIKKYKTVTEITYVEKDPAIIEQERLLNPFPVDSNLTVISRDAFSYLKENSTGYDVIIMLIPHPSNLEANRYFTVEFYELAKKRLNPGGVFLTTAGPGNNYPGKGAGNAMAITFNSLKQDFTYVLPVKGSRIFMVASDNQLSLDYPGLADKSGIVNDYVNSYYLDSTIIAFNSSQLKQLIASSGDILNSLSVPSLVYFNQENELSKETGNNRAVLFILAGLVLLPLLFGKRRSRILYSVSFNLAGIEIIVLIIIQSTIGSMYQFTGIIIATLMAGLAAGASGWLSRIKTNQGFIPLLIVLFTLIIAMLTAILLEINVAIVIFPVIMLFLFIPAFLTGRLYRISAASDPSIGSVSGLYGSDLFGGAAGFLVVSSFLIPLAGLQNSLLILAFFNFATYLTTIRKGTFSNG